MQGDGELRVGSWRQRAQTYVLLVLAVQAFKDNPFLVLYQRSQIPAASPLGGDEVIPVAEQVTVNARTLCRQASPWRYRRPCWSASCCTPWCMSWAATGGARNTSVSTAQRSTSGAQRSTNLGDGHLQQLVRLGTEHLTTSKQCWPSKARVDFNQPAHAPHTLKYSKAINIQYAYVTSAPWTP